MCGKCVCDQGGISDHRDKDRLFNKGCWDNWVAFWKQIKCGSCFTAYGKIKSKWTRGPKANSDTNKYQIKT